MGTQLAVELLLFGVPHQQLPILAHQLAIVLLHHLVLFTDLLYLLLRLLQLQLDQLLVPLHLVLSSVFLRDQFLQPVFQFQLYLHLPGELLLQIIVLNLEV